ncbi:MAG: SGNH/GDSL hydrolase family protein [Proteobacteria bacterium]|nr:SGNH/GDSL hydrolase family protein [Pseudomonadota bacterium]
MKRRVSRLRTIVTLGALALVPASAIADQSGKPCRAPPDVTRLDRALVHTARQLATGEPLRIVAIGSSSTAGAGASSPLANYPNRLQAELRVRFHGHAIEVINRGVNGDTASDMVARFDSDVIAEKPHLVLWQVGSNSVLREQPVGAAGGLIRQGVRRLQAAGADVVLINPQFAPKILAKHDVDNMLDVIEAAAKESGVGVFRRFRAMRHWRETDGLAFNLFLSADDLHMNDWSYACIAKLLGAAIAEAATRPAAEVSVAPRPKR